MMLIHQLILSPLRKFATKTFLRGGKKSSKMSTRKDKYVLPPGGSGRTMPLASSTMLKEDLLTTSMESVRTDSRPGSLMFDEDELSSKGDFLYFLIHFHGLYSINLPHTLYSMILLLLYATFLI